MPLFRVLFLGYFFVGVPIPLDPQGPKIKGQEKGQKKGQERVWEEEKRVLDRMKIVIAIALIVSVAVAKPFGSSFPEPFGSSFGAILALDVS